MHATASHIAFALVHAHALISQVIGSVSHYRVQSVTCHALRHTLIRIHSGLCKGRCDG